MGMTASLKVRSASGTIRPAECRGEPRLSDFTTREQFGRTSDLTVYIWISIRITRHSTACAPHESRPGDSARALRPAGAVPANGLTDWWPVLDSRGRSHAALVG